MVTIETNVRLDKSEGIINNAPRVFNDSDFPVGTVSRQGDLYFVRIGDIPHGATEITARKLAEGDTQGSRHIVEGGTVYRAPSKSVVNAILSATGRGVNEKYIGPVFVSSPDDVANVTHPEHGHQAWACEAVIAVVFQRNLDAERREQIARD